MPGCGSRPGIWYKIDLRETDRSAHRRMTAVMVLRLAVVHGPQVPQIHPLGMPVRLAATVPFWRLPEEPAMDGTDWQEQTQDRQ